MSSTSEDSVIKSCTVVDVHTHVYPPAYMDLLRSRKQVPYVRNSKNEWEHPRLVILPGEDDGKDVPEDATTSYGRMIGPEYFDVKEKIAFMDIHGIDISVISLANPWLDFLEPIDTAGVACRMNDAIDEMCDEYPGRLFAFGALPWNSEFDEVINEIYRLSRMKYIRGIVMGTSGLGKGLDDPQMEPVYQALEEHRMTIFLHPHYGLPQELYGPRASEYGHILPLALGFPMETTIAVSRMILSNVFDKFSNLQVLLAHSGGTLPFLAGRLESCINHDMNYNGPLAPIRRNIWDILKNNILLDAVVYSEIGVTAAAQTVGSDRLLFGTDHPFFPPYEFIAENRRDVKWESVTTNVKAIKAALRTDLKDETAEVLGGNAIRHLRLTLD